MIHVSKVLFIWHNSDLLRLFDPTRYGKDVEAILALDGHGERLMPLTSKSCSSEEARTVLTMKNPVSIFPAAAHPEAALSGLWLYFSCFDESHSISQDLETPEGSYWHGILHRQEPDAGNAAYWFRRVGSHPTFEPLRSAALNIVAAHSHVKKFPVGETWDPFEFIEFCEYGRQRPGSEEEQTAREIQRAEWQLLFDHCARPR